MHKKYPVHLSCTQAVLVLHGKHVLLSHLQLNNGYLHVSIVRIARSFYAYEAGKGTSLHTNNKEVLRTHQSRLSGFKDL